MSADEFDFELCVAQVEAHHREVDAMKAELAAARAVIDQAQPLAAWFLSRWPDDHGAEGRAARALVEGKAVGR